VLTVMKRNAVKDDIDSDCDIWNYSSHKNSKSGKKRQTAKRKSSQPCAVKSGV
jgi:hypothetical protein